MTKNVLVVCVYAAKILTITTDVLIAKSFIPALGSALALPLGPSDAVFIVGVSESDTFPGVDKHLL